MTVNWWAHCVLALLAVIAINTCRGADEAVDVRLEVRTLREELRAARDAKDAGL